LSKKDILEQVKTRFVGELDSWCRKEGLSLEDLNDEVVVSGKLSAEDAIGRPERDDFPLLRGKEVMMQAIYRGSPGQAFTPGSGDFKGTLGEILNLPLEDCFQRAVLISTINAVLRHLGFVDDTIHCKDEGPEICASHLGDWIQNQDADRIGLVGLQPALLESVVTSIGPENVMVSDLMYPGEVRSGVTIIDGMESSELFEECQMILVTGSTLVNGTIDDVLKLADEYQKRVVFYGTTISGAARLMEFEKWCFCST